MKKERSNKQKTKFSESLAEIISRMLEEAYKLSKKDLSYKELSSLKNFKRKYKLVGKTKLSYITSGNKKNPPLIFFHGIFASAYIYRKMLNILSKKFQIYAFDLPGFGKSDIPKKLLTANQMTDLLYKCIKSLKIKNPIIMGHSAGGLIALNLTLKHPKLPKKIILLNSAGIKLPYTTEELYNRIVNFKKNKKDSFRKEHLWKESLEFLKNVLRLSLHKKALASLKKQFSIHYENDLKKIKIPALVIGSKKDNLIHLKHTRRLHKKLPYSRLLILEGSHHWPVTRPRDIYKILDEI